MNRAVVTICCGPFFERLATLTHPTMAAYARRIGADFLVWRDYAGHTLPHYQKLELGKLLAQYQRVLYLDTDVLVREDAPDLFELVPPDALGMMLESDYVDRRIDFLQYSMALGYDARQWDGRYYNAGVMVLSQAQRELFVQPAQETNHLGEQTYLNLLIARSGPTMFPLPYRFNRMYFMDWLYGEHRCDSYLIHYAGVQLLKTEEEYLDMVADDLATWRHARPGYRFARHFAFVVQGGLADQLAAEPAIRFARESLYPRDDLVIVSPCATLFRHLNLPVYASLREVPDVNRYLPRYNLADPIKTEPTFDRRRVHRTTAATLSMLDMELPLMARASRLSVDERALATLRSKLRLHEPARLVAVHPSAGAATTEEWSAALAALRDARLPLAVVGTSGAGELAIAACRRDDCVDLVDRLSLDELVALASRAPVVLAGDSPLVQLAGAFDAAIGLVGAGVHADYVLPWRHGSPNWRTRSFDTPLDSAAVAAFAKDSVGL